VKDKDRELREILKDYGTKLACSNDKCTICQAQLKKNISQIKALVMESLGEEHTKISQIIHKVCRNSNWACDSWGEEELTVAIIAELKEKWK